MLAQSSTCASPMSPCTHGDHAACIILDQTRSGLLASNQRPTASKEGTARSITTICCSLPSHGRRCRMPMSRLGKRPGAHMHRQDALKQGETEDRLLLLSAWRESGLYTERERAALAWAESLTRIAETHAPDAVYDEARAAFSDDELVAVSIGVATINAWNRLAIGFRLQHPADRKRAA